MVASRSLSRRGFLASVAAGSVAGCTSPVGSSDCPADTGDRVGGRPLPDGGPRNARAADRPVDVAGLSASWTATAHRRLGLPVVADGTVVAVSPRVDTDEFQSEEPPSAVAAFDAATGDRGWRREVCDGRDLGQAVLERDLAVGGGAGSVVQRTLDDRVANRLPVFDAAPGTAAGPARASVPTYPTWGTGWFWRPVAGRCWRSTAATALRAGAPTSRDRSPGSSGAGGSSHGLPSSTGRPTSSRSNLVPTTVGGGSGSTLSASRPGSSRGPPARTRHS